MVLLVLVSVPLFWGIIAIWRKVAEKINANCAIQCVISANETYAQIVQNKGQKAVDEAKTYLNIK